MVTVKKVKFAIFDVAGTTAKDGGLVVEAFQSAMISLGTTAGSPELQKMTDYVNATMGERKIDVFMHLCDGDSKRANLAHDRFVESYIGLVTAVAITTGFPRDILDNIIDCLKWAPHIDFSVAASEVAMGRPAPDMIFRCIDLYNKRFNTHISAEDVAVIGDTESDMKSGVTAGAHLVVGVDTGTHTPDQLFHAGATHVLHGAVELPTIC